MSTPHMSEGQLRDVLARVVPDPPDSVADPATLVRTARVRRRAQVVGVAGVVALVAVAGVLGGRAVTDDDSSPHVVDEPSISVDPYGAVACPHDVPSPRAFPTRAEVVAVRYCGVPSGGFPGTPGPPDALVDDIASFVDAVAAIPEADPARCAAISIAPGEDRLLLQLADGSTVTVPAGMCQNVDAGGRMLDGGDVARAFVSALDAQRNRFDYEAADTRVGCQEAAGPGPVRPGRETLVAAAWCFGEEGTTVGPLSLELLNDSWDRASVSEPAPGDGMDPCLGDEQPYLLARTDRGDVIPLSLFQCERLSYTGWEPRDVYNLDVDVDELTES